MLAVVVVMAAQAAVMVAQVADPGVTASAMVELQPSHSRRLTRLKRPRMLSMLLDNRRLNKPDPN